MTSVKQSYRACRRITARASSTFYLASLLFDGDTRRDIQVLYAFCRVADDIADDAQATDMDKRSRLREMKRALDTLQPVSTASAIWPAFFEVMRRHRLPKAELIDVLRGVASDIRFRQPQSLDELDRYSYYVAGVVGILSARVLGAHKKTTFTGAKQLGIAMQYTNIIRDVAADYRLGRVYIPKGLMQDCGVTRAMLAASQPSPELVEALKRMGERAERYYSEGEASIADLHPTYQRPVQVATALYHGVLERAKQKRYTVLDGRIRLNRRDKLAVVLSAYRGR